MRRIIILIIVSALFLLLPLLAVIGIKAVDNINSIAEREFLR